MVRSWTDEKRYFRRAALPKFSTTGRWSDVGHYPKIIWHSTTDVGCAIAVSQSDEYLVCRYTKPGNVYGRAHSGGDAQTAPTTAHPSTGYGHEAGDGTLWMNSH